MRDSQIRTKPTNSLLMVVLCIAMSMSSVANAQTPEPAATPQPSTTRQPSTPPLEEIGDSTFSRDHDAPLQFREPSYGYRSLAELESLAATLLKAGQGMLGLGATWSGGVGLDEANDQTIHNNVAVLLRAAFFERENAVAQLSAPIRLEIGEDGSVYLGGTVSARGMIGTRPDGDSSFGIDFEEELDLWRGTDRIAPGGIQIPSTENGTIQSQGLTTTSTLWLRRTISEEASFALPVGYTYQGVDLSDTGRASNRQEHRIHVGGGIRVFTDYFRHSYFEAIGVTWSNIKISDVPAEFIDPEAGNANPDDKTSVELQEIDLKVAHLDELLWLVDDDSLMLALGGWVGANWLVDNGGSSEGVFAYHGTFRVRGGDEDFVVDTGVGHDRRLSHDVTGQDYFIEYVVEGILAGESSKYGFGAESKLGARWLFALDSRQELPAALTVSNRVWLTLIGPLDLGFYHRSDQLPEVDQRAALPWRHELGLYLTVDHLWD